MIKELYTCLNGNAIGKIPVFVIVYINGKIKIGTNV